MLVKLSGKEYHRENTEVVLEVVKRREVFRCPDKIERCGGNMHEKELLKMQGYERRRSQYRAFILFHY